MYVVVTRWAAQGRQVLVHRNSNVFAEEWADWPAHDPQPPICLHWSSVRMAKQAMRRYGIGEPVDYQVVGQ